MTSGSGRAVDRLIVACTCVGYLLAGLAFCIILLFDTDERGLQGLGDAFAALGVFFIAALLAVLCGLIAGVGLVLRLALFGAAGIRPATPLLAAPLVAGSVWLALMRLGGQA